jgi:ABC-type transport system substrate-binding protein
VERVVIPGSTFWNDWTTYPISSTGWNHRELGVEILNLAYRSGVAWNETAYSNPEFDALLDQANGIQDADARREIMAELQQIMQEDAVTLSALLAVALPARGPASSTRTCIRSSRSTSTTSASKRDLTIRRPGPGNGSPGAGFPPARAIGGHPNGGPAKRPSQARRSRCGRHN